MLSGDHLAVSKLAFSRSADHDSTRVCHVLFFDTFDQDFQCSERDFLFDSHLGHIG